MFLFLVALPLLIPYLYLTQRDCLPENKALEKALEILVDTFDSHWDKVNDYWGEFKVTFFGYWEEFKKLFRRLRSPNPATNPPDAAPNPPDATTHSPV